MSNGSVSFACGEDADSTRQECDSLCGATDAAMCRRLVQSRATGDLAPDTNPADLVRYVATVIRGMSVPAVGGASRKDLLGITP
jgi:hypothetical protein